MDNNTNNTIDNASGINDMTNNQYFKYYYAIKRGFDWETKEAITDTIVKSWPDCKKLIRCPSPRYKKFASKEEAKEWLSTVDKEDAERKAHAELEPVREKIGLPENKPVDYMEKYYELSIKNSLAGIMFAMKAHNVPKEEVKFKLEHMIDYVLPAVYNTTKK